MLDGACVLCVKVGGLERRDGKENVGGVGGAQFLWQIGVKVLSALCRLSGWTMIQTLLPFATRSTPPSPPGLHCLIVCCRFSSFDQFSRVASPSGSRENGLPTTTPSRAEIG
jgi:hypothetical protein